MKLYLFNLSFNMLRKLCLHHVVVNFLTTKAPKLHTSHCVSTIFIPSHQTKKIAQTGFSTGLCHSQCKKIEVGSHGLKKGSSRSFFPHVTLALSLHLHFQWSSTPGNTHTHTTPPRKGRQLKTYQQHPCKRSQRSRTIDSEAGLPLSNTNR